MARLLVTRPLDDAQDTAARLEGRGHSAVLAPLMVIDVLPGPALNLGGVQALLMTSVNGVRSFVQRQGGEIPGLPVFAVGDATARAARTAGFADVESAGGDVGDLAALAASRLHPLGGTLLHPAAGEVAGDLGYVLNRGGYAYRREILYQARTAEVLPPAAVAALNAGAIDGVLLYSPRTALAFDRLATAAGLRPALAAVDAFCLSANVADRAGAPWRRVLTAARPTEDALLALIDA